MHAVLQSEVAPYATESYPESLTQCMHLPRECRQSCWKLNFEEVAAILDFRVACAIVSQYLASLKCGHIQNIAVHGEKVEEGVEIHQYAACLIETRSSHWDFYLYGRRCLYVQSSCLALLRDLFTVLAAVPPHSRSPCRAYFQEDEATNQIPLFLPSSFSPRPMTSQTPLYTEKMDQIREVNSHVTPVLRKDAKNVPEFNEEWHPPPFPYTLPHSAPPPPSFLVFSEDWSTACSKSGRRAIVHVNASEQMISKAT